MQVVICAGCWDAISRDYLRVKGEFPDEAIILCDNCAKRVALAWAAREITGTMQLTFAEAEARTKGAESGVAT